MKRVGHLFERVHAFENLLAAYGRARRGKRGRASVERFARRLEPELFRLQDELASGSWQPGTPVTFRIHDPKERINRIEEEPKIAAQMRSRLLATLATPERSGPTPFDLPQR